MLLPSFEKGNILKQNMLEALRDYPYRFGELMYLSYGDGIITGFDITIIDDEKLSIAPGILKWEGELYISTGDICINQVNGSNYVYLKMVKKETTEGIDCVVEAEQFEEPVEGRMELFRYVKNAEVRKLDNIDEVFSLPINRINQIYCKRSIDGGSTLCEQYFEFYAQKVLVCSNAGVEDIAFSYQCLNGIHSTSVLRQYFGEIISNDAIVDVMKKKIAMFGGEKVIVSDAPVKKERPKQMIVS